MSKKLLMKPLKVLASPGIYLFGKYNQYKRERQRSNIPSTPAENELSQLNTKIDKLLSKLNGKYAEIASTPEEECVICVNAKAVMQTYPCGHKVVCRRCFVKTIQIALAQRTLPLRCVICRAKILRLKHSQNNKLSSIPPFQSRSSSCSTSKQSSEIVTSNCLLESNPWSRVTKYSKSLPGISGGSFKSAVYRKSSTNSMQRHCRSYSLNSCTIDKGRQQKPSTIEYQQNNFKQQNINRRRINEISKNQEKHSPTDRNKSSEFVSREKLIQQFQRDFKEGQLLSSRSTISRNKQLSNKGFSTTPKQNSFVKEVKSNQKADIKYSNVEKRKPIEHISVQENSKYREKQNIKIKDKSNAKIMKLPKLEKKDKNKSLNECTKNVKCYKKEKKMKKN